MDDPAQSRHFRQGVVGRLVGQRLTEPFEEDCAAPGIGPQQLHGTTSAPDLQRGGLAAIGVLCDGDFERAPGAVGIKNGLHERRDARNGLVNRSQLPFGDEIAQRGVQGRASV